MLSVFKPKTQILIGLDISNAAVKLIELSRENGSYRVESYGVVPLPQNAVVEKNIKKPDVVATSVRKVTEQAKTGSNNAAVAVADSFVITKVVQMGVDMSDDDIEQQIALEADRYIPYPLEEVSLDFEVLGVSPKNENVVDILIAASRREYVDSRVGVVDEAGLEVKVVDVDSYAMERACHLLADDLPNKGVDQTIAVVDIGSTMTNLTVLSSFNTIFTREEVFGGEQLTREIQRHYGLSYAEAGLAKKQGNLPDDYFTEILEPFKESTVVQIRRSLQFFFSSSQHSDVDHIVLAGGSAAVPGLAPFIEQHIGVRTTIANPFSDMAISPKVNAEALARDASSLMISCGLALRSFDE